MDGYIEDLCYVIRSGDMQNTYKTAWIRAIVEICSLEEGVDRTSIVYGKSVELGCGRITKKKKMEIRLKPRTHVIKIGQNDAT